MATQLPIVQASDAETGGLTPTVTAGGNGNVRRVAAGLVAFAVAACVAVAAWGAHGNSSPRFVGLSGSSDFVALGDMDLTCNKPDILDCCDAEKSGFYCVTYTNSTVTDYKVTLTCLKGNGIQVRYDECAALDYLHQSCFPGSSEVQVQGVGAVPMSSIQAGDRVRVSSATGEPAYEPVLSFLHTQNGHGAFLTVTHSCGELRATENHLVFVDSPASSSPASKAVAELRVGESLVHADGKPKACKVLSVQRSTTESGLHSPLTASGTLIVDDMVASVYAQPSKHLRLAHSLAHAAFFPVRVCHALGLCGSLTADAGKVMEQQAEDFHPYVAFMYKHLHLQQFLSAASPAM